MPEQSRAKKLAVAVADLIEVQLGDRATVKPLWHPSFASKQEIKDTVVTVRAAKRGRTADGRVTGVRDVMIEIGVVRHLPKPQSLDDDPYNDDETLDELDLLSEQIYDMFCRIDEDEYEPPAGVLANECVLGYVPRTPDQPATLDNALLESDRVFLTVTTVPYQRME